MADSQNYRINQQKYTRLLPSIYTFSGLIFQKPLTCIRNDIVLHVYFNPKCNENWRKAAYHASSDSACCQLAYAPCVYMCVCDVRLPNFAPVVLTRKLITGDIKFLSKIKYFPNRPTRLSGLYVTGTKQNFILSWPTCKVLLSLKVVKINTKMMYLNFSNFRGRTSAGGNKPWSKNGDKCRMGGIDIIFAGWGTPSPPGKNLRVVILKRCCCYTFFALTFIKLTVSDNSLAQIC